MLRYSIVTAVQNAELYVIAQFFKYIVHHMPCPTLVMVQKSTNVFKQENFWLCFFYYTGELIEQRTSSVFKPQSMTHHRESLTRSSTNHKVYFAFITSSVEVANIRKPVIFADLVIGKIALFAFGFNIASKHDLVLQTKALKSMFNGAYPAKNSSYSNCILWLRKCQIFPRFTFCNRRLRNLFLVFQCQSTFLHYALYLIYFLRSLVYILLDRCHILVHGTKSPCVPRRSAGVPCL